MPKPSVTRTINIDGAVSPDILASLLGVNVNTLYNLKDAGKIPDFTKGRNSYAECLQGYVSGLEEAARGLTGNLAEQKIQREIQHTTVKTETMLLDMKIKRQEYGSYLEIKEILEPIIYVINSGLNNISRKFGNNPEIVETIDNLLSTLHQLGNVIVDKAKLDGEMFVKTKMAEIPEIEKEVKKVYNLDEDVDLALNKFI